MSKTTLLYLIILIEGYVVLACELLAIRQLIPFVGSGTEVVSIVIAAVLLPLALGYQAGGGAFSRRFAKTKEGDKKHFSVRKLLVWNMLAALFILAPGLSLSVMESFFGKLAKFGIENRLAQTTLYSSIFLVVPLFLLGQTVPLISNYFSRRKLSEVTGRMLFFSTAGSFLGSVFSTIVLMMVIGVNNTVIVTLALLTFLVCLLTRAKDTERYVAVALLLFGWWLSGSFAMQSMNIVSNNAYNTISIQHFPDGSKAFMVNRSPSSMLGKDGETMGYVEYLEMMMMNFSGPTPRDALVIGSGGFTFGVHDEHNNYTYVDIDPDIKATAEKYFLEKELTPNKKFIPASAREFVHKDNGLYDLILIDVYTNVYSTPMETTTREFLLDVKKHLKENGVLVLHTGTSPAFEDTFTVRYHNTFASVFPTYTRQVFGFYNPWPQEGAKPQMNIILYMYFNRSSVKDNAVYTDDLNTYSLDRK